MIANCLGGIVCTDILEGTLSLLLKNVPLNVCEGLWFQHSGAPFDFLSCV
jgi:hypothetical protein